MATKISVVITIWHRYKFLEEALNSVIRQNFPTYDYEIFLVGKADENILNEIINQVKIKRENIKIAYEEVNNESIGEKLYRALEIASGKVLVFLEDDDIYYADKLSVIDKLIDCDINRSFFQHAVDYIDENSNIILKTNKMNSNPYYITDKDWFDPLLPFKHNTTFSSVSSMAICKHTLQSYSDFVRRIRFSPDRLIHLVSALSSRQKVYYLNPLGAYRVHKSSFSKGYNTFDEFLSTSRFKYKAWFEDSMVYLHMSKENKRLWDISLEGAMLYKTLLKVFSDNDIDLDIKDFKNIIYLMRSTYASKKLALRLLGMYILSYLPYNLRRKIIIEKLYKKRNESLT